MKKRDLPVIGWREWVSLPGLGVDRIKAKVDTGARTSAIHAEEIQVFKKGEQTFVRFKIYPMQSNKDFCIEAEALKIEKRKVRSSTGTETTRVVILTELNIGGFSHPIELTLVNRDPMGFRMLLGRTAMNGHFLVDPSRSYILSKSKK